MDLLKFSSAATFIMVMVTIKTTFITDVQSLKISGRHTNYTWILERIWIMSTNHTQDTFKNRIPGIRFHEKRYKNPFIRWRRFNDDNETDYHLDGLNIDDIHVFDIQNGKLKEIKLKPKPGNKYSIGKLLKKLNNDYDKLDNGESQSQTSDIKIIDTTNYNQPLFDKNVTKLENALGESEIYPRFLFENYYDNPIEFITNSDEKSVKRRTAFPSKSERDAKRAKRVEYKVSEQKKLSDLLHSQQKRKREELLNFMKNNYISTNYLYQEMKRIIRDRTVKDELRAMAEDLEGKGNEKFKKLMLKYYDYKLKVKAKRLYDADFWKHRPNNLVIRDIADPFNNGE